MILIMDIQCQEVVDELRLIISEQALQITMLRIENRKLLEKLKELGWSGETGNRAQETAK